MVSYNPDTTWLGLLGGGVSGSILAGGSIFQIDLWNMGAERLPVRALVTGKRVGFSAEVGTAMAALLVTGCRKGHEMEGITSSGIDWELSVGLKGSNLVKAGARLFKTMASEAAAHTANWVMHESAKRFVQWTVNDLGVVQDGRQFNLLPSPIAFGVGGGIFYEWQTLNLLKGKVGWQHISPQWSVENVNGDVYLQMVNIPEQDGTLVRLGFAVSEWGIDPHIRWKKLRGDADVGQNKIHILGYVYEGALFASRGGMGMSGINLSNFQPIGRSETGVFTVDRTDTVAKNTKLKLVPQVFEFSNYAYWSASDTMTVEVDGNGIFRKVEGTTSLRD